MLDLVDKMYWRVVLCLYISISKKYFQWQLHTLNGLKWQRSFFNGVICSKNLDLQDTENPNHFWPVSIMSNRGSFLTLKYLNLPDSEETLFYSSEKLFPRGYAAEKEVTKTFLFIQTKTWMIFWIFINLANFVCMGPFILHLCCKHSRQFFKPLCVDKSHASEGLPPFFFVTKSQTYTAMLSNI